MATKKKAIKREVGGGSVTMSRSSRRVHLPVEAVRADLVATKAEVLCVGAFEGVQMGGALGAVDAALGGEVAAAFAAGELLAKEGSATVFRAHGRLAARAVVVLGLGAKSALTLEAVRKAAGCGVRTAKSLRAKSVAFVAMGAGFGGLAVAEAARAVAEGASLAAYAFDGYKTPAPDTVPLASILLVERDGKRSVAVKRAVEEANQIVEAVCVARDLVNESAMHMTPAQVKAAAEQVVRGAPDLSLKSFDRAGAAKLGMHAFLAVAQGSAQEPYFLHLTYTPKRKTSKRIVLVGKGITFDSGGLSLKSADNMETMKVDMAGAAVVIGVFQALRSLRVPVEVHGLIAACENMPSGSAYRPGDVVQAKNGKTIEVLNTDAEGRVTLADSLSYGVGLEPMAMVDFATLTGACVVALGEEVAGLMTDHDALADAWVESAKATAEPVWRLPLFAGYNKVIESRVADVKNIGNRWGGALTAGLFLKKFVGETPWMHIDIAGPAYAERDYLPYVPLGGTGYAVRTAVEFLKKF
jgi:leucyl aminopeptidase